MNIVYENLKQILLQRGFKVSFTDVIHISELKDEINHLRKNNVISDTLYDRYLYNFEFDYQKIFPTAKTIITVALPSPISKINFTWKGKNYKLTIPPTYTYHEADETIETIENLFNRNNIKIMQPKLPFKLLAVRTGISKYGRNNISYTDEFGSFYRILVFLTDCKCSEDNWMDAERMESCSSCSACLNVCPTKTITSDRSVIHAEKCLTFINESRNSFPNWVDEEWHNSIIGCMKCQAICPKNRTRLNNVREYNEVFTNEDIEAMIDNVPFSRLSERLKATLEKLSLAEYYFDGKVLGRNLKALISRE